ncbi:MAG: hypothetical protein WD750_13585 [Gammaproteobacteria bacterium]
MMNAAFTQDIGPGAPDVDMDTPSMDMDTGMPGQDGMAQDRDLLLLEKGINDIDQARGELAAMSAWEAPGSLSEKEREEWNEQSRRLEEHIGVLEDLSSSLRDVVENGASDDTDYEQVKSEARSIINGLHNDVTTRNIDGDMAVERQRAVADSLDSVSIL